MTLEPAFVHANYAEACLWTAFAVITFGRSATRAGFLCAAALLLFGVSDIVETRTGAWYEPWWLLVWKTVCVAVIAGIAGRMRRNYLQSRGISD